MIENIRAVFENEEEHCYKPKRVSCFRKNNYTEHEINGDKNSNFSLDKYLNKIKHYLRNIITDLQNSDTCKTQVTIASNIKSSKDSEEQRAMRTPSDNIKCTLYNDENEVINELFESLRSRD